MEPLWHSIVQGLHGIGIHLDDRAAGSIAAAGTQGSGAMDLPNLVALAAALGWASGFRLYAVVFLVGAAGQAGWIALPPGLAVLQHPAVLIASGVLLGVEFFADKIPGVDSLWDLMQSVIRIPAGAALAAGALGADGATAATTLAALLGGTLAATSQATKTTTRAAINTSPEPFSNLLASLFEDGLVVGAVWLAVTHPFVFGGALLIALALMAVVTVTLFKFLRAAWRRLSVFLSGSPKAV
ncbi:MAG: DUF4126 domain-containing protein [Comamonadaceae bacterium]|nr:DUF4126 domain-containing protein [Comamonadaceae bacterium]